MQATAFRQGNQVEFVVADGGVGIPKSMGIVDHKRAVEECINEGVTRDKTRNADNGLYGSFRVAALSDGGQFDLHSLHGHLYLDVSVCWGGLLFRQTTHFIAEQHN